MLISLCFCWACAELAVSHENVPRPISARKTPARTMNRPIKTRKLGNPPLPRLRQAGADCEVEFSFIRGRDEAVSSGRFYLGLNKVGTICQAKRLGKTS